MHSNLKIILSVAIILTFAGFHSSCGNLSKDLKNVANGIGGDTPLLARWAQTVSGPNASQFLSVKADSNGNIYAAGIITGPGTYNFGNGVFSTVSYNGGNIILVKYNSDGTALWAQTVITGPSDSVFNSVCVDISGNIYAAGYMNGVTTFDFGNGKTAVANNGSSTGNNVVLVKYDSNGATQWARTCDIGSTAPSQFLSVCVDSGGNIYAAGEINSGTYTFNSTMSVTSTGIFTGNNTILVKYNSAGQALWAQSAYSAPGDSTFYSVSVDSIGNIYAAGYINDTSGGTFNFNPLPNASATGSLYADAVIVKYDSSGNAQWAQTVSSGINASQFNSVSIDGNGNIYAAGYITGTSPFNFGGQSVAATNGNTGTNTVLVKYNSGGQTLWAQTLSSASSSSQFNSVCIDSFGNPVCAGYIFGNGSFTFDGINLGGLSSFNGNNIVVVKYNPAGVAQSAQTVLSGLGASIFQTVCTGNDGRIYAAGNMAGTMPYTFGSNEIASGGSAGNNAVLVKY